ncbi:unnamed protein product [Prorocentrum cordatum]|uniref:Uncharacterized protein n=1 Tax=Prorocentrum cordatum TaxID=2364126 RepID=A0ABN9WSX2_9DINO|nr:unnamed protein product [Polarella glacialis]
MEEVAVKHLHDVASHKLFDVDLLAPKMASARLAKALRDALPIDPSLCIESSASVHINGKAVYIGDVVAFKNEQGGLGVGEVYIHAQIGGRLVSVLSKWTVSELHASHATCTVRAAPRVFPLQNIFESCIFRAAEGFASQVLLPGRLQLYMRS